MAWQLTLSIVPIIVSGFFAWRAQQSAGRAARLQQLEERLATKKLEVYEPLIRFFAKLLDPQTATSVTQEEVHERISTGATWIVIFGSDGATRAFQRFMQCSYADAPPMVVVRAYADFVLAARVDMGYPDTELSVLDLMGMRMSDVYTRADHHGALTLSFQELCRREGWTPPWERTPSA